MTGSLASDRAFTGRRRIAALTAAIALVSIFGIGLSLTMPLLSLEMERMGASGTLIGLNTALAGLASIAIAPFVPRLAARFGVARMLGVCILTAVITLIGFRMFYDLTLWFPIRFLYSAAIGALFVLSEYWINAAAPSTKRGLVMGIYASVLALGFAAGPTVLALAGTSGWPPYIVGASLLSLGLLPLLAARGLMPDLPKTGEAARSVGFFMLAVPTATFAAFIYGAIETGAFALLPIYGLRLGLDEEHAAFLVSIVALGNVALQMPIGFLSDKMDRRVLLFIIGVLGALGASLIPLTSSYMWFFYTLLFIWGGIAGALYTVGLAHLGARYKGIELASANAAFIILYNMGLVIGPPAIGWGMDRVPPHGFAAIIAAFFGLYVVLVLGRMVYTRAKA